MSAVPPVDHSDRAHARCSPSKLDRVLGCPGSCRLEDAAPPEVRDSTGPAAWGEAGHEKAEKHLLAWTDPEPGDEHVAHTVPYLECVRRRFGGPHGHTLGRLLVVEQRVDIVLPDCFGTFDAAVVDPFECVIHVIDLKTGRHAVDPTESVQLGAYAIGLLRKYAGGPKDWLKWTVQLVISQAAAADGRPAERAWGAPGKWFVELEKSIKKAIKASHDPAGVLIVGSHCRWCRAAPVCPAKLGQLAEGFPLAADGPDAGGQIAEPTPPELLSPETLSRVLALADQIRGYLDRCETYAIANTPPGWKVVQGRRGHRRWIDPLLVARVAQDRGVDPYAPRELVTPAAFERIAGGKRAFTLLGFAELCEAPDGKPQLVPATDPRPPLALAQNFPLAVDDAENIFG